MMKLQFDSNQQYQIDAINSAVNLFKGQPLNMGDFEVKIEKPNGQMILENGFVVGNNLILKEEEIIKNLHDIQEQNDIEKAEIRTGDGIGVGAIGTEMIGAGGSYQHLKDGLNFSVEMETGTGKTYVYLRTIHELNKRYGFKKFIIVVPSVAIKEGVLKNLEITKEHFAMIYDKPEMDFYVYDPKKRGTLRNFSTNNSLQILVINIDSFAIGENKLSKRIIYQDSDWGIPIKYIQATKPIVIVDEPQNMETDIRKKAIQNLNPLCTLRYSATHKYHYNLIYKLDPVKAYDLNLVKRIEVDSVLEENNQNEPYIELESVKSQKNTIAIKLKIDTNSKEGISRKSVVIKKSPRKSSEYDLFKLSGEREIYRGYMIDAADVVAESITFSNGKTLYVGQSIGGVNDEIMKFQIRQTIQNHFEKEQKLKDKGIKVLSLFFIDKVANYREYQGDTTAKGKIAKWFEEVFEETKSQPRYASSFPYSAEQVHNGYFSKDKKGQLKDTKGDSQADDDTYSLIMKDKEKLLSQDEPLRFIFSHSALREGWDNPNVFQICTLNETKSELKKRQEIGRGLRLPVNQDGQRIFDTNVNVLTVIANESYEDFAKKLQTEIEDECNVDFSGRIKNKRKRKKLKLRKEYYLDENFKSLWDKIKQRTQYQVEYSTEELIEKASEALSSVEISKPKIISLKAKLDITKEGITTGLSNISEDRNNHKIGLNFVPDILGYIQNKTKLTKDTILKTIQASKKDDDISNSPQQFMDFAVSAIKDTLQKMMIDGIKYEKITNEFWEMKKFEDEELEGYLENLVKAQNQSKTLYDYVMVDSNVESEFAKDLDLMENVKFYFKLPYWFKIETPIGSYNPDWAIVFENDKKVYFVAETKGTEDFNQLREDEKQKIKCGQKHFEQFEGVNFRWGKNCKKILSD